MWLLAYNKISEYLTAFTLVYLQYKHDLPNWTYNNNNRQHDKFIKLYLNNYLIQFDKKTINELRFFSFSCFTFPILDFLFSFPRYKNVSSHVLLQFLQLSDIYLQYVNSVIESLISFYINSTLIIARNKIWMYKLKRVRDLY